MSPEVARRGLTCPSAAVIMAGCGPTWPCAWSLAPRSAPRNLVSGANVRTIQTWMPPLSEFGIYEPLAAARPPYEATCSHC